MREVEEDRAKMIRLLSELVGFHVIGDVPREGRAAGPGESVKSFRLGPGEIAVPRDDDERVACFLHLAEELFFAALAAYDNDRCMLPQSVDHSHDNLVF